MKKTLLLILMLLTQLFPQLKELEVKPTENRGGIPIFRDHPDKAGIIFYTQFDDLKFYSSYGIVDIKGDPAGGKYVVIIEPVRQTIEVRAPGYKTEMFKLNVLQPRDVLYYEVLPKKVEGISGVSEIAITVQVNPADALIYLDNKPLENNSSVKVPMGTYDLKIAKPGYKSYENEIEVSAEQTLFSIKLDSNDPVLLNVTSDPAGAEILINGENKGVTPKTLPLSPGIFDLKLLLPYYLSVEEKISVSTDEQKNIFFFKMVKNTGKLKIEVIPESATVRINKEVVHTGMLQDLSPGFYQIEVEAPGYVPFKTTLEIKLGDIRTERIVLVQKSGKLQFKIIPPDALCVLSQNGVDLYSWSGIKILNSIPEGSYELLAKAVGYKPFLGKVIIQDNQSTSLDIQMLKSMEIAEGMVHVKGGTFNMGCTNEQIDCEDDEFPTHKVTLNSYVISKHEVTQAQWESVMGYNPSHYKGPYRPVEQITWYDAVEFCNRLSDLEGLQRAYSGSGEDTRCDFKSNGYRLATEAEWEFAARGGVKSKAQQYSGSSNLDKVGWYGSNSESQTRDVGLLQANELGLHDMSGNVWEWCWDWKADYNYEPQTNPKGPGRGSNRVIRGGSSFDYAKYCRVANRDYGGIPGSKRDNLGFRLVRTSK